MLGVLNIAGVLLQVAASSAGTEHCLQDGRSGRRTQAARAGHPARVTLVLVPPLPLVLVPPLPLVLVPPLPLAAGAASGAAS
jgi:hypothetical protein